MSKITNKNLLSFINKNRIALNTCLYFKDLDFEFPHVLYQSQIKSQILEELEAEEKKLHLIEENIENELKSKIQKNEEETRQTYENYYAIRKNFENEKSSTENLTMRLI